MKKIAISIVCLFLLVNSLQAQTCSPTSTFNNAGTSAFTVVDSTGGNGGTITVTNGVALVNGNGTVGVQGNRECRAYVSIPTLGNTFTAECTVGLGAGSGPWHAPIVLSAGTQDFGYTTTGCANTNPINSGCATFTPTNQSALIVYITIPGLLTANNVVTDGTAIAVYTKVGVNEHVLATGSTITIPASAIGYFKIRLERISATQGRLSYINPANGVVVDSKCFAIPSAITGLNTLQAGVLTSASYTRNLRGTFNSYNIYNGCNLTALPIPTVSPVSVCGGTSAALTASTSTPSPTFSWFSAATGGTALATSATYNTPVLSASTTYYVSYTDACGQVSARQSVLATVIPSPSVSAITGDTAVCKNQIIALETTTPGGVWSSSNTAIATVKQTGVVKGVAVGTVTISYTVTSGACSNTVTKVVSVRDVLSFIITGPDPVCPNTSGHAYTVSPVVTGADYTWNIQDGPNVGVNFPVNGSVSTSLSIPDAVAGNQFTIRCVGLNACGKSEMATKLIHVNTAVPPNPNVTCSGTSGSNTCVNLTVSNNAGYNIEWIVGGVVQSTSTSFVRPLSTTVICTYTNPTSGCKKSTWYSPAVTCTYALRTTQSEETQTSDAFKVYPNPTTGDFTFVTNGYSGKALVVNVFGQVVEEVAVHAGKTHYEVPMTGKPKGTYVLKLEGGDTNHVSIIVVQ